ncbi:hypothetical protein K474DRAFT_1676286 [Panus rudis PR-1116 ss-1]|nr:hypothetical protein K474DRAFT_1676286 [Panus rudis PR-1116 ss-1]
MVIFSVTIEGTVPLHARFSAQSSIQMARQLFCKPGITARWGVGHGNSKNGSNGTVRGDGGRGERASWEAAAAANLIDAWATSSDGYCYRRYQGRLQTASAVLHPRREPEGNVSTHVTPPTMEARKTWDESQGIPGSKGLPAALVNILPLLRRFGGD